MEKIDARTLTQEVQEAVRRPIVGLRKAGYKVIAENVSTSEGYCSRVWAHLSESRRQDHSQRKARPPHGEKRILTTAQDLTISKSVVDFIDINSILKLLLGVRGV
jgi:hypothetical protein